MKLVENMMEDCRLIEKKRVPDGAGGFETTWVEGADFQAAIIRDTSLDARIAEKSGVTSVFTVTTHRSCQLAYHDVFKRLSDGKTFRVTSDAGDKVSPQVSGLDMAQVTAEKWELTT